MPCIKTVRTLNTYPKTSLALILPKHVIQDCARSCEGPKEYPSSQSHTFFWIPARLLLDFQKGIDILFKQLVRGLGKMPHFVDGKDVVPFFKGFLQLHTAPRPLNSSFAFGMGTGSLVTGVGTGLAKSKHQFALGAVKKDRMEQPSRWKHHTLAQPEIGGDVIEILDNDSWMP